VRRAVTVLTGRTVTEIDGAGVTLEGRDGGAERIASRTAVWAAGVTASGLAGSLADQAGADRDRADPHLPALALPLAEVVLEFAGSEA
jgi:NADH dehydrogenase